MTITAALVLYAVIWFMALFVALPLGVRSQGEAGDVTPGTPASAPDNAQFLRKVKWVTLVSTILWAVVCAVIISGAITVRDLDWFNRMGPAA